MDDNDGLTLALTLALALVALLLLAAATAFCLRLSVMGFLATPAMLLAILVTEVDRAAFEDAARFLAIVWGGEIDVVGG